MKYMFLIYGEESNEAQLTSAERDAMMAEYFAFSEETRAKGVYVTGDELKATATATTLRARWSNCNNGWTVCRNQRATRRLFYPGVPDYGRSRGLGSQATWRTPRFD